MDNDKTVIDEMKNVFSELLDIQDKCVREQGNFKNSSRDITTLTEEYSRLTTIFEAKDGYLIDVKIKPYWVVWALMKASLTSNFRIQRW